MSLDELMEQSITWQETKQKFLQEGRQEVQQKWMELQQSALMDVVKARFTQSQIPCFCPRSW